MRKPLVHGLTSGFVFGLITVFLLLIGFLSTIADLMVSAIDITSLESAGLSAQMVNLLIFLGLLGAFTGIRAAPRTERDSWTEALLGSAVAGLVHGLIAGSAGYLFGTLTDNGVKLTTYLSAMLPETVNLYILNRAPLDGSVSIFLLIFITSIAGGLIAKGLGRSKARDAAGASWQAAVNSILELPGVKRVQSSPITRYVLYGVLLLIVFLLPQRLGQYWNYTVGTIGIYVLLGLGLNIVVGLAGLLDLGYVAFFAIGAYTVALMTAPEPHALGISFWVALISGLVLAALAGILLGVPVLRMRGDYLAIVTLGFGEIIRVLSRSDLLTPFTGGPRGVRDIAGPEIFGRPFSSDIDFVYLITLAVILIIFITNRLQNSRVGRAWVAMREDETVAQAMGIDTMKAKLLAFSIGAAFAGVGGVLFASRNQFTGPEDHNLMVSINVLSLVIVGGMGSIPGVIAGAFVLKGLPEVLRQLENFRILAFGALLVVMMIWRPEGLIPSARRQLEMHEEEPPPDETVAPEASPAPSEIKP